MKPAVFLVTVTPVVRTSAGRRPSVLVDAVLHVHRGQVGIAPDVEVDVDGADAAVRARRLHVGHALDAVHDLLEGVVTALSTAWALAPV